METALQYLLTGVSAGTIYAMVALGFYVTPALLGSAASFLAMCFQLLGLFLVQGGVVGSRVGLGSQEFIQLGVDGQGVALHRTLHEKRHDQRDQRDSPVPIERLRLHDDPGRRVGDDQQENRRVGGEHAQSGEGG